MHQLSDKGKVHRAVVYGRETESSITKLKATPSFVEQELEEDMQFQTLLPSFRQLP